MRKTILPAACLLMIATLPAASAPMKVLIVDGQNNHDWKSTTPVMKRLLEETGLFAVDVATSPLQGGDMSGFKPAFSAYAVVLSNYNGDAWSRETQTALERYVRNGGGLVVVHAADNAFREWKEYNRMIGLGGWGGRNEKDGPYVRWKDGRITRDMTPGPGGSHGAQHEFAIDIRDPNHPITRGLPPRWMHVKDELYDRLRGPAENLTVLATAFSDPKTNGSGAHEPQLMAIAYGNGRVFHDALGHGPEAMRGVGFIVTLQRGTEWAATGKVTQRVPADFPTATEARRRP